MKFADSRGWRTFMSRLYGWGAAVVIMGALFKIMHWQFADLMLILGMGTEVIVFFLSGFENPPADPDWSIVYPELAGQEPTGRSERQATVHTGVANITLSNKLDQLLDEANIGPELINNLGRGLRNLSENASRLADMSNAAVATNQYIQNLESASKSVVELNQTYKNTAEYLKHGISLSQEYSSSMKSVANSMSELSDSYKQTASSAKENLFASEEFSKSLKSATGYSNQMSEAYSKQAALLTDVAETYEKTASQSRMYSENVQRTAHNLSALNAAYELQLQASNVQAETTGKLNTAMASMMGNMQDSLSNTQRFQSEMEQLTSNIRALNSIYGNMLTAMNVNTGR